MKLLYPTFLLALLSLLVPIIIHILNLQRTKKVQFTNLTFLREVKQETNRRYKLKRLLILFMRLLTLFFLVLAFCQPLWQSDIKPTVDTSKKIGVYIDNSQSMSIVSEQTAALTKALKGIEDIISVYKNKVKYQLINNLIAPSAHRYLNDKKTQEELSEINICYKKRTLEEVSNVIKPDIDQLYIFSDFQKSTIGNLNDFEVDSNKNYNLIPITSDQVNVYIDSIWLNEPYLKVGTNYNLFVKLKNTHEQKEYKTTVELKLDGVVENKVRVTVQPLSTETIEFNFTVTTGGIKKGEININDSPVTFDNIAYFTLQVAQKIRVGIVSESKKSWCKWALQNEPLYKVNHTPVNKINYEELIQEDLLIVENIDRLEADLWEVIIQALQKGKNILIFPGKGMNETSINKLKQVFPLQKKRGGADSLLSASFQLSTPDDQHPFFKEVFEKKQANINLPYSKGVLNLSRKGDVILQKKNGDPFFVKGTFGKGNVYLCESPLDDEYSTLQRHSLFVPVLYKTAQSALKSNNKLYFEHSKTSITIKGRFNINDNTNYYLKNNTLEIRPIAIQSDEIVFNLPEEVFNAGYYTLMKGKEIVQLIAINQNKIESENKNYTLNELEKIFSSSGNVRILQGVDTGELKTVLNNLEFGTPLWKFCLILSLLFILAEILIIRLVK